MTNIWAADDRLASWQDIYATDDRLDSWQTFVEQMIA